MEIDSFEKNIEGVSSLVNSDINKNLETPTEEVKELVNVFSLDLKDEDLLILAREWTRKHEQYYPSIKTRASKNKEYYSGRETKNGLIQDNVVSSNLIFEAQETFIPSALAKNPEPVVWSDNTPEGQEASNQIKAVLQYKADTMGLRKKLIVALRHWSIYFIGILKHGWDEKAKDFTLQVRNPKNFIWDPEAYIDETARYIGEYIGEKIEVTAEKLIKLFPEQEAYILIQVDGKLGTKVTYTEWWTDEYCFYTFKDNILDKHKNQFFNYEKENSEEDQIEYGYESVTPGKNHFAHPIMPYSFFSVFTLQEHPHDITNLIEQAIPNQDRIIDRDKQIDRNLKSGNNSIAVSGVSFTVETARQASQALEDGNPVLVPDGQVDNAIKRIPASPLPNGLLQTQENEKMMLRQIFGTQGITPEQPNKDTTARGLILNQNKDSSRIGGGIGESLEQLADNVFNWWLQMMYVFYDEPHYASILGQGQAVTYVKIINSDINRNFVVSVTPNSMAPKDEVSERNEALQLANAGWLDPINLLKKLDYADPNEVAKQVVLWKTNPQQYFLENFSEQPIQDMNQPPQNPPDIQPQQPQEQPISKDIEPTNVLSRVKINK